MRCGTAQTNHRLYTSIRHLPTGGGRVVPRLSTDSSTTRSSDLHPPTGPGDNPAPSWGWTVDKSEETGDESIHRQSCPQAALMIHKLLTVGSTGSHVIPPAQTRLVPSIHSPYYYGCKFLFSWKKRKKEGEVDNSSGPAHSGPRTPLMRRDPDDALGRNALRWNCLAQARDAMTGSQTCPTWPRQAARASGRRAGFPRARTGSRRPGGVAGARSYRRRLMREHELPGQPKFPARSHGRHRKDTHEDPRGT